MTIVNTREEDGFKMLLTKLELLVVLNVSALAVGTVCTSVGTVFKAWTIFDTAEKVFVAQY